jgi:hypothetical protein
VAYQYTIARKSRPKSHRGWLFLVIVGYCFFAALKFFLQVEDPWPFFTLLVILLGLSLGAYAFSHQTADTCFHGIAPKGTILLSDKGMEIRGESGERRDFAWTAFADIVLNERRRTLTFFPETSLSFEFSPTEIASIDEMAKEIGRYFKLSMDNGLPLPFSND